MVLGGNMLEQALQKKIIAFLEGRGAYVIKTIVTNKTGCPDLLVCYLGKFIALEVKAPGKLTNLTELQKAQLGRIENAGGIAIAVDSLEMVEDIVKDCEFYHGIYSK